MFGNSLIYAARKEHSHCLNYVEGDGRGQRTKSYVWEVVPLVELFHASIQNSWEFCG